MAIKTSKPLLIVIAGPTASGKSALAVRLAKKFNGEVVSADSRQVYRGLNIGTGKITRREMKGVPHHLLDVASPHRQFTVADFQRQAQAAIRAIIKRKKIPILAGGTGFWVDAVVYDLALPPVPPNRALRKRLERKRAQELLAILQQLDPQRSRTVEPRNPRRLIRAIEVAAALGHIPKLKKRSPYRVLWIGIRPPAAELRTLIAQRLRKRLRAGMIAEAKQLHRSGLPWKRFYELGLEYRFLADYLRGRVSKAEMIRGLESSNRDLARRQMRWFKRNPSMRWIQTDPAAERAVHDFISGRNQ